MNDSLDVSTKFRRKLIIDSSVEETPDLIARVVPDKGPALTAAPLCTLQISETNDDNSPSARLFRQHQLKKSRKTHSNLSRNLNGSSPRISDPTAHLRREDPLMSAEQDQFKSHYPAQNLIVAQREKKPVEGEDSVLLSAVNNRQIPTKVVQRAAPPPWVRSMHRLRAAKPIAKKPPKAKRDTTNTSKLVVVQRKELPELISIKKNALMPVVDLEKSGKPTTMISEETSVLSLLTALGPSAAASNLPRQIIRQLDHNELGKNIDEQNQHFRFLRKLRKNAQPVELSTSRWTRTARNKKRSVSYERHIKEEADRSDEILEEESTDRNMAKEIEWATKLCAEEKLRIQSATNEKARQKTLGRIFKKNTKQKKAHEEGVSDLVNLESEEPPKKKRGKKTSRLQKGNLNQLVENFIGEDHRSLTADESQKKLLEKMNKQREEEKKKMQEAESKRKQVELEIEMSKVNDSSGADNAERRNELIVQETQNNIKKDIEDTEEPADDGTQKIIKETKLEIKENKSARKKFCGFTLEKNSNDIIWDQQQMTSNQKTVHMTRSRSKHVRTSTFEAIQKVELENLENIDEFEEEKSLATRLKAKQKSAETGVEDEDLKKQVNEEQLSALLNLEVAKNEVIFPLSNFSSKENDKVHGSQRRKIAVPKKLKTTNEIIVLSAREITSEEVSMKAEKTVLQTLLQESLELSSANQPTINATNMRIKQRAPTSSAPKPEETEKSVSDPVKIEAVILKNRPQVKSDEKTISEKDQPSLNTRRIQVCLGENAENARDEPFGVFPTTSSSEIEQIGKHFYEEFKSITITFFPKQIFYGKFELEITRNCCVTFVCDEHWPRIELSLSSEVFQVFSLKHVSRVAMAHSLFGDFPAVLSLCTTGLDDAIKKMSKRYDLFEVIKNSDEKPSHSCHPNGLFMVLDVCAEDYETPCKIHVQKDINTSFEYKISVNDGFDVLNSNYQLVLALHPVLVGHEISFHMLNDSNFWDYSNHLRLVWIHIVYKNRNSRWIAKCRDDMLEGCNSNFVEFHADGQYAYSLYPPFHRFKPLNKESIDWFDCDYQCRKPFPLKFKQYPSMLFEPELIEENADVDKEENLPFEENFKPIENHQELRDSIDTTNQQVSGGNTKKQSDSISSIFGKKRESMKLRKNITFDAKMSSFSSDVLSKKSRSDQPMISLNYDHCCLNDGPSTSNYCGPSTSSYCKPSTSDYCKPSTSNSFHTQTSGSSNSDYMNGFVMSGLSEQKELQQGIRASMSEQNHCQK